MDPLEREFAEYTLPPSMMPEQVTETAAKLVNHASSSIDSFVEASEELPTELPTAGTVFKHVMGFVRSVATKTSVSILGRVCDAIAFCALAVMIYRTLLYVKQRRRGLVGPAMAPRLIKFWACFGVGEFMAHMLTMYLTPFKGAWVVSCLRAIALLGVTSRRRLIQAVKLYDLKLAPFLEAQEPEIEALFSQAKEHGKKIDDGFQVLAKYLLDRMAVGGLSGVLRDLSEAVAGQGVDGSGHVQAAPTVPGRAGSALPSETDVFSAGRQFFAGVPEDRADAVANLSTALPGVIRVAAPEPPKAAYGDLRALRRKLSIRARQKGKGKDAPP